MDVRESYDSAARAYAEHLAGELVHKPLDRALLARFAEAVGSSGTVLDLGCGPGHVAAYLTLLGVSTEGIDISSEMIRCALELNPGIPFHVGDFERLAHADASIDGLISFYSIVHLAGSELERVFKECRRVLRAGGPVLLAFHTGQDILHADDLFGAPVSLDFHFHLPDAVIKALETADFTVIERSERAPYPDVEYPSNRCYLLAVGA